jgi:hypothetical protein
VAVVLGRNSPIDGLRRDKQPSSITCGREPKRNWYGEYHVMVMVKMKETMMAE